MKCRDKVTMFEPSLQMIRNTPTLENESKYYIIIEMKYSLNISE